MNTVFIKTNLIHTTTKVHFFCMSVKHFVIILEINRKHWDLMHYVYVMNDLLI